MAQGADVHAQARGRFFQPKDEGGYFYFGEERTVGAGGTWWCPQPRPLPRYLELCSHVGVGPRGLAYEE